MQESSGDGAWLLHAIAEVFHQTDSLLAPLVQAGSGTHGKSLIFCTIHHTLSLLLPHLCTQRPAAGRAERRCGYHPGTQENTKQHLPCKRA